MTTKIINNFVISDAMKAYDSAVKEIETLLMDISADLHLTGWSYSLTDNAPESFKDLVDSTVDKHIFIASYGCDNTIYSKPLFNHLFRFWHDVLHLVHGESFSANGESVVASYHLKIAKARGLSPLALRILDAETNGQVQYYYARKEFVQNQEAFVATCLQHGIKKAIRVKH